MNITASTLRNNIYRLLDRVAEGGEPLVIERKGYRLKVVCENQTDRLSALTPHDCINGDPEDLIHLDWSGEWKHDLP